MQALQTIKNKLKKINGPLQWIFVLVFIFALVFFFLWFRLNTRSTRVDEETFLYFVGSKIEYSSDMELSHTEDGVMLEDGETSLRLDATPLLFPEQNKLLLPHSMSYVSPMETERIYRVNYFSTITEYPDNAPGEQIAIEQSQWSTNVDAGFLYDGQNTYVFLEPMEIVCGNKIITVAPLSYATVIYQTYMEVYNTADGSYEYFSINNMDVTATAETGYTLNLGTDVLNNGGLEQILYTAVDQLDILE